MERILCTPMLENDADAPTIKDYLKTLLIALWREGEGFSGKRPFGNSGWEFDLYKALVADGAVAGKLDEWGCLDSVDRKHADKLIFAAIESL